MWEAEFSQQQSCAESPKWGAFPASASLQVLIFVLFLFISIPLKTKIPMFLALKPSRFCLVLSSHKAFLKPATFLRQTAQTRMISPRNIILRSYLTAIWIKPQSLRWIWWVGTETWWTTTKWKCPNEDLLSVKWVANPVIEESMKTVCKHFFLI